MVGVLWLSRRPTRWCSRLGRGVLPFTGLALPYTGLLMASQWPSTGFQMVFNWLLTGLSITSQLHFAGLPLMYYRPLHRPLHRPLTGLSPSTNPGPLSPQGPFPRGPAGLRAPAAVRARDGRAGRGDCACEPSRQCTALRRKYIVSTAGVQCNFQDEGHCCASTALPSRTTPRLTRDGRVPGHAASVQLPGPAV